MLTYCKWEAFVAKLSHEISLFCVNIRQLCCAETLSIIFQKSTEMCIYVLIRASFKGEFLTSWTSAGLENSKVSIISEVVVKLWAVGC